MSLALLEGNEAIAWGALSAGCRFFAGYPITPATTILNTMLKLLPPTGGTCIQGEDEIASIGFCLGASMAGLKAMTATSGPGISLYSEHISFALGSEIPLVIVDVQRLGPSTGSATRGADGDIQFLRWGSSGGLSPIVLAPVDVQDAFLLTMHAFNLAEEFRCPVFIAANKEIGMTRESIDLDAICKPPLIERSAPALINAEHPFLPFAATAEGMVPHFLPIGGKELVRQTSSTHGKDGYISTNPTEISQQLKRLNQKLAAAPRRLTFYETFLEVQADTLIITYGITARAAKSVYRNRQGSKAPVALLILKTLWPVCEQVILEAARGFKRILVVEMNLGQYVREIERLVPERSIEFLGQMNGALITPQQIEERLHD